MWDGFAPQSLLFSLQYMNRFLQVREIFLNLQGFVLDNMTWVWYVATEVRNMKNVMHALQ